MLWMERISIIVYVIFTTLFLLGVWFITSDEPLYAASATDWIICFKIPFFIALAFWILARSIDYIFGGPLRRKIKRESNDYYPIR